MMQVDANPFAFRYEPHRTALVIIDMQRDFIEPGGFGETLGNDVSRLAAIVPACRNVLQAWRERGGLVVHTRESAADTVAILREEKAAEVGGVMHCFTESWEVAEQAIDLGFLISFSGIVTFKNAAALKEVARRVPLDGMLVETDSPYLAPVPHRGKTNEPGFVRHVAEEIARLKAVAFEDVARTTTENFFRLFRHATA